MPLELFMRCFHSRRKYASSCKSAQRSFYAFDVAIIVKPVLHAHVMQGVARTLGKRFLVGVQHRIGLLGKVAQVDTRILFPVFSQKMVAKNIHHDSRKLSEFRPQCLFTPLNDRMRIGKHIDLPMQPNAFNHRL